MKTNQNAVVTPAAARAIAAARARFDKDATLESLHPEMVGGTSASEADMPESELSDRYVPHEEQEPVVDGN